LVSAAKPEPTAALTAAAAARAIIDR
jgi:hypothetical protein